MLLSFALLALSAQSISASRFETLHKAHHLGSTLYHTLTRRALTEFDAERSAAPFTIQCRSLETFVVCERDGVCGPELAVARSTQCVDGKIRWLASAVPETIDPIELVAMPPPPPPSKIPEVKPPVSLVAVDKTLQNVDKTPVTCVAVHKTIRQVEKAPLVVEKENVEEISGAGTSETKVEEPEVVARVDEYKLEEAKPVKEEPHHPQQHHEVFHGGKGTFFYQDGHPSACGTTHHDGERLVAMAGSKFASNGWLSDDCGRWLAVTNTANGKTTHAVVRDMCPTCPDHHSLDLSVSAFEDIADKDTGVIDISWHWL